MTSNLDQNRLNHDESEKFVSTLGSTAMALAMIAAFLLVAGGIKLSLARDTRVRGILMMVAAAVLVVNVLLWTI
jgi:high-affinity Fe2+/Pb2+ permease